MAAAPPPRSTPAAVAALPPSPREPLVSDRSAGAHPQLRAERWTVRGASKVTGDVDATEADLSGSVSVGGALTAERLKASGALEVLGDVRVRTPFKVHGHARFLGSVQATDAELSGHIHVGGSLAVERTLTTNGSLEVGRNLSARNLWFDGPFRVGGEVTAHEVEGRFVGDSRARAIKAEFVRISRGGLPFRSGGLLTLDRIEATTVSLEGVECEYLWADRVKLGPDCHIARLDGTLRSAHASSHVGPESRSPRPFGITR